ncbi:zinc ribbon domain-containing protein [Alkalibacillus aidingensis]|uniref:zinc ribbon domain-containing protein n=1 Tax=Alkalibacillus aidingensis TaxID=2747607 RepID=UPI0016600B0A|nr:zinc-ribbon domain-containing protein [Alkalibacillus aidingensis]
MKYCRYCGNEVKETAKFCHSCGGSLNQQPPKENVRKKMTKRQKVITSSIIGILAFMFIAYQIGASITSKEAVLESFEEALIEGDINTLEGLLVSADERVDMNTGTVEYIASLVEQAPSSIDPIMDEFYRQADAIEEGNEDYGQNEMIRLVKDGKRALLFDRYQFEVQPFYVIIQTNFPDTDIRLDEEVIHRFNGESEPFELEYGPLLPGQYEFEARHEGEYTTLMAKEEVELIGHNEYMNVNLYMDSHYVDLHSNYSDAEIIVDGKPTGKSVEELPTLGPVPDDGSLVVQATKSFPWQDQIYSEEVEILDQYSVSLDINPVNQDLQETIIDVVRQYEIESTKAFKDNNPSVINVLGDEMFNAYESEIESNIEDEVSYYGKGADEITFDLSSFSYNADDDILFVDVQTTYVGDYANDDDEEYIEYIINGNDLESRDGKRMSLIYEDDSWKVNNMTNIYYYSSQDDYVVEIE